MDFTEKITSYLSKSFISKFDSNLKTKQIKPKHDLIKIDLLTAAAMGYNECVQLLIEHGASMEVLMG